MVMANRLVTGPGLQKQLPSGPAGRQGARHGGELAEPREALSRSRGKSGLAPAVPSGRSGDPGTSGATTREVQDQRPQSSRTQSRVPSRVLEIPGRGRPWRPLKVKGLETNAQAAVSERRAGSRPSRTCR